MRRPRKATGRPRARREVGHALDPRDRGREARHEHAPARAREHLLEGGNHGVLAGRVRPGCSTLVLSESSASTPRSPHCESDSTSVRSAGGAVGVDLEVAARQHDRRPASRSRAPGCRARCARRGSGARGRGRSRPAAPGRERRRSALTPRSCRRFGARSRGSAGCRRREPGPPGARRRARRCGPRDRGSAGCRSALPARSARYCEVGDDRVDPRHLGRREQHPGVEQQQVSCHSSTIAFRPNSPRPPSGIRRTDRRFLGRGSRSTRFAPRRIAPQDAPEPRKLHN